MRIGLLLAAALLVGAPAGQADQSILLSEVWLPKVLVENLDDYVLAADAATKQAIGDGMLDAAMDQVTEYVNSNPTAPPSLEGGDWIHLNVRDGAIVCDDLLTTLLCEKVCWEPMPLDMIQPYVSANPAQPEVRGPGLALVGYSGGAEVIVAGNPYSVATAEFTFDLSAGLICPPF